MNPYVDPSVFLSFIDVLTTIRLCLDQMFFKVIVLTIIIFVDVMYDFSIFSMQLNFLSNLITGIGWNLMSILFLVGTFLLLCFAKALKILRS